MTSRPFVPSRGVWVVLALALAGCGGAPTPYVAKPAAGASLSPRQIADRAMPSIVLIRTPSGLGSGFIVSDDGRIVTNLHVIAEASEAIVVMSDGREFGDVDVVDIDEDHDLALLHVHASNLHALTLGDLAAVRAGDHVVAIGHPLGLGNTVSDGLVSAVRVVDPSLTLLQISAPIAPGSSGGPLFNEKGEVIGVATLFSSEGQNLNFGVPVSYLKPMMAVSAAGKPIAEIGRAAAAAHASAPHVVRHVPHHELKVLAGCADPQLEELVAQLDEAIEIGAPLYNDGNPEACFRVYEGAALDLDKKLKGCGGVKKALAEGVKNAAGAEGPHAKAWAMRDAFDGVIDVVMRKVHGGERTDPRNP